jgi:hypothetical protein
MGKRSPMQRVMEAACKLARDYWHRTFDAADRAEDAGKRAAVEARRKSETLFQVAPDQAPKLFDEGSWFGHAVRTDDELAWAEQRLRELRFEMRLEDRTKSYVRQEPDFVVFADPRFSNRIDFSVYAAPQAERLGTKRTKADTFAYYADFVQPKQPVIFGPNSWAFRRNTQTSTAAARQRA